MLRWGVDAEKEYDLMIAERERQRRLSAETDCWETATKNYQGSSAIAIEETIEHLKEIVELYPDIGRIETKEGQLPLHAALEAKAPDKIIRALLEIYPEAIERITPLGDMPLHIALRVNYGHQTITHLGSLFPEACSLRDKVCPR